MKTLLKGKAASIPHDLFNDYHKAMEGHAIYLTNFLCSKKDTTIFDSLVEELDENKDSGMEKWSQHQKHEDPDFSPTFQKIVRSLSVYFDVEVYATRLNYYANGEAWKPYHHDSHAYGDKQLREDFTIGASLGQMRQLSFVHVKRDSKKPDYDTEFSFPQNNGDVFAFDSFINTRFQHGIVKPRINKHKVGPRFSVILWGRRRTLNERNSGQSRKRYGHFTGRD